MIRLSENLPEFSDKDVFLTRIYSAYLPYKNYPDIARFYQMTDEKGKITAVISSIDGNAVLYFKDGDINELKEFFGLVHFNEIFCDRAVAEKLGFSIKTKAFVLKKVAEESEIIHIGNVKDLYEKLSFGLTLPDCGGFMTDVSHRVRHGGADFYADASGGVLVYFCKDSAFLSAVAVKEEERGKGKGSFLLSQAQARVPSKQLFVCSEEKNIDFYIKNGFTKSGEAVYCEAKQ